jgi:hypothetical protein
MMRVKSGASIVPAFDSRGFVVIVVGRRAAGLLRHLAHELGDLVFRTDPRDVGLGDDAAQIPRSLTTGTRRI